MVTFIKKIKENISKKIESDRKFNMEIREAALNARKEQQIRAAIKKEEIRADAAIAREKARFESSPKKIFIKSLPRKKMSKKDKKSTANRGIQSAIPMVNSGKFNAITGKGRTFSM